jgi:hypothetical protein
MAVLSAELESKLEIEKMQLETLMYNFDRASTNCDFNDKISLNWSSFFLVL